MGAGLAGSAWADSAGAGQTICEMNKENSEISGTVWAGNAREFAWDSVLCEWASMVCSDEDQAKALSSRPHTVETEPDTL